MRRGKSNITLLGNQVYDTMKKVPLGLIKCSSFLAVSFYNEDKGRVSLKLRSKLDNISAVFKSVIIIIF
jgi:hypothetical protein